MTSKLGVSLKEAELQALLRDLDENGSGEIEFEEFNKFLVEEAYTKYRLWITDI